MIRNVSAARSQTVSQPVGRTAEELARLDLTGFRLDGAVAQPMGGGAGAVITGLLPDGTRVYLEAGFIRDGATKLYFANLRDPSSGAIRQLSDTQRAQVRPVLANRMDHPAVLLALRSIDESL